MPRLKQPVSLEDAAMDVLLVFWANRCDKYSKWGYSNELCQVIDFLKEDMCPRMPPHLEEQFCYELIKKFLSMSFSGEYFTRPKNDIRAVAEVIMDRRIIGLRCSNLLTAFLNPDDARRIQGLESLDLGSKIPGILKNYHLQDITVLVYQKRCTDSDLELLGRKCQKLLHLDVCYSNRVTNVGLRALSPCSDLHTVLVMESSVSQRGILELLSANKKLRRILAIRTDESTDASESSLRLGSTVYPSIESVTINLFHSPHEDLKSITVKFPNLKSLEIEGIPIEDLVLPDASGKISELELSWLYSSDSSQLRQLVRFVGANLKKLTLFNPKGFGNFHERRIDLDFIFQSCANLEEFASDCAFNWYARKLVIPEFKKLKVLRIFRHSSFPLKVEFGQMCELERLWFDGYRATWNELESIILDHTKFPKLKKITLTRGQNATDMSRLRQNVKVNNLDLEFEELWNPPWDLYE